MTTTDLEPGDIVQHPERKCHGIVRRRLTSNDFAIVYADKDRDGIDSYTNDLTGWERAETCTADERSILNDFREVASGEAQEAVYPEAGVVIAPHDAFKQRPELVRPGHVQVRVDDLELGPSVYETEDEFVSSVMRDFPEYSEGDLRLIYRALAAQRAESTPPADEKPSSATVTLFCPDCGEPITNTAMVEVNREGERYLDFCIVNVHTCPPAQPDEPTEFGARVTVTLPDGTREKWLRSKAGTNEAWRAENGSETGWFIATTWDNVIERGTATLGWDE